MAQLGRRLAILGMVLMAVTMLVFGREIERALQSRCVAAVPLETGKEATSGATEVEAGRGGLVAFEISFESRSVQGPGKATAGHTLRYSFPFTCTVLDAAGNPLFSEQGALRWDQGTRLAREETADASGGRGRVQHNLSKFDAPSPGKIEVKARLLPDAEYGAKATAAELKVYDNVTRPREQMILGAVALLFGPAVMVSGVVLAIAGWLRARREPEPEGEAEQSEEEPDAGEPESPEQ